MIVSQQYRSDTWNLDELAAGPQDPAISEGSRLLLEASEKFESERRSLAPEIQPDKFLDVVDSLAEMAEANARLYGYASLLHSADTQSDAATSLLMQMSKMNSEVDNRTLFFDLWWKNGIDQKNAERLIADSGEIAEYLRHKRRLAEHTLSEPEEQIINTLSVTGQSALVKLYDKITNAYKYKITINGKRHVLTREEMAGHVRSPNPRIRKAAYRALLSMYGEGKGVTGSIYQNVVQNWADEGVKMRRFKTPLSVRNVANNLDDDTVDALLAVCQDQAVVFQRFFELKAKMLRRRGRRLRRYDIYAPIKSSGEDVPDRDYDSAVRLVLGTFDGFSRTLGGFARQVIDGSHVDSEVRHGKREGAFCMTVTPRLAPYILLNYTGKTRDVFTLAHEMGHAVHSMAAGGRSILVQDAPLPLAETASTFAEMLLYDTLAGSMSDDEKKGILYEKIDDMYATIMRQAFFTIFEIGAHRMVADGCTIDDISNGYMDTLYRQFGSAVDVSDDFAVEWCCIPHFYHTPFYCYAYSFGNLLSLSLFSRYKAEGQDFVPAYVDMLSAGGSQKPEDLLSGHGFDITRRQFWQEGFDYIRTQVRVLENLL